VHHPLMYFPVFYMIKDFVTSDAPNPVRAVKEYSGNVREDLVALWKVWIPSTFLNFAFMPMWARIPWVASTSLIWTCILSAMRGGSDVPAVESFGHVDGQTLELFTRALIGPAPRLTPDQSHLLVNIVGPDRPGVVREVAAKLYETGGSITHSKMLSLGSDFAIVMHVACLPADVDKVRAGLTEPSITAHGVEVTARTVLPLSPDQKKVPAFAYLITLTGVDRPGLVYRLTDLLASRGLNIEHLQTEQHRTRGGSPQLFTTHCHVCGHGAKDDTGLRAALRDLERELNVKCTVEGESIARLHRTISQ